MVKPRPLVSAARSWAAEGYSSLTVSCAHCDIEMYRPLGFDTRLGATLALNF